MRKPSVYVALVLYWLEIKSFFSFWQNVLVKRTWKNGRGGACLTAVVCDFGLAAKIPAAG